MTPDPLVGRILDNRYEVQARIGEGGMGVVYKARQLSIDRTIALKVLSQQMAQDPTWVQRFYNEAKACSRLQHPNTIRIFDFGQTSDGRLFMTMEFLDGQSLREIIEQGPLAPQRVAKILIQACASLAEAHAIGIIHRDLKPDNVFLLNLAGSQDFVKVLDFSVAKLIQDDRMRTQAGIVFGTPQYMSPEQGRGAPLDARSDLYALGILAFEMLTGMLPFHDDNPMTVIQMHLRSPVPPMPDSVPYAMQMVVKRALEKDPARRYQSAGELMQHCQQVFAELSGGASVGAAGMPRTMVPGHQQGMGGPPPGFAPGAAAPGFGAPPQQGAFGVQQKTMIANAVAPPAGYGAPPQGYNPPQGYGPGAPPPGFGAPPQAFTPPQQGGFLAASPMQKTMIAQAAPPMPMSAPMSDPSASGPAPAGGPQKTVMLQPSDGVVSMARATAPAAAGGASTAFWLVSLFVGLAAGVLAYVIYRQL